MRNRSAVTLIEVMIATRAAGFAAMSIMNLIVGTSREAGFSEAHILIQARAFGFLTGGGSWLRRLLAVSVGHAQDTVELPVRPPCRAVATRGANSAKYQERLTFRRLRADGSKGNAGCRNRVVLGTDQGRGRAGNPHVFKAFRLLTRPDDSWLHPIPLPLSGSRRRPAA